jgi:hypothetical protein
MAVVKTTSGSVVTTSGGRVSVGNCGTGAGGFKSGNTCAKGQSRAKSGGEIGPNGEWYPGGAFIATTELSKMAKASRDKAASGRKEIEPYKYEVPPAGQLSIYGNLGPGVALQVNGSKDPANWSINEDYVRKNGGDLGVEQARGMLDRYRKGDRFVPANDFYLMTNYDDIARMAVADIPISGDSLSRMAKIRGVTVEELQKQLGIKRFSRD